MFFFKVNSCSIMDWLPPHIVQELLHPSYSIASFGFVVDDALLCFMNVPDVLIPTTTL